MGKGYRVYREGYPHHTFTRGIDGNVIFYSTADCLYFTTLYCCLARRYGISPMAFSIMPNHVHSNERAPGKRQFLLFHSRLNSEFSHGYNEAHGRAGALLDPEFGYAAKTVGKRIRDNLCYIANNATVGKLCDDILKYRWNLLAYRESDHPFSEKIVLRRSSRALQRAVRLVRYFRDGDVPMTYVRQEVVMKGLNAGERQQLTDFIIVQYNCLDYRAMESFYQGSFTQACLSFRANSGSEYDIPEDYEDYSIYREMNRLARNRGVDLEHGAFETMHPDVIASLVRLYQMKGFPVRQIRRFLHLKDSTQQ